MELKLKSTAFDHKGRIPDEYTCKGEELSPPLHWEHSIDATKSFVLIMDDLDTPIKTLNHWILFNIPSDQNELVRDVSSQHPFSNGMIQGRNSMRKNEYMGPCPPFGSHRYRFTLYALDTVLEKDSKMNKKRLLKAIDGHVLARSELIGSYSKK